MKALLLGTGAADGVPNAFCTCPTCRDARVAGRPRTRTCVLIDDVILIDPGPDCAAQAARAGIDLRRVEHVLVSHGHPDHLDPSHLLAHAWADGRPLQIHGPERAMELIKPWLGPDTAVRLKPASAGAGFEAKTALGVYRVTPLPAEHSDLMWVPGLVDHSSLLFDIRGPAGHRLLYMSDTAPLPDSVVKDLSSRGDADLVLLEETFGRVTDHGTGHLDLRTFPREVARLREHGIRGRVIPIHLGHHNPPRAELASLMAGWGAELHDDLALIELSSAATTSEGPLPVAPLRTLVTGGVRSGKSHWAEQSVANLPHVRYIATAPPRPEDAEWEARLRAHRERRPDSWTLLETGDVAAALTESVWTRPGHATLVDCLALWLTRQLDDAGAWEERGGYMAQIEGAIEALCASVRTFPGTLVLVTNEVGAGVVPATRSGRLFADVLGTLNRQIASACDRAVLLTAGIPLTLKDRQTA